MSEHEEEDPPEADVAADEFKFSEIAQLEIAGFSEKPKWNYTRTSCLGVANKFGVIFVGVPAGIKVLSCSTLLESKAGDVVSNHEIATISLRKQPTWIAVSSDNLILSVFCCSDEGIQCLYFDIRNIFNKGKPIKTPFHQTFLSKSKDDKITSLMWNPSEEFAHLLALSLNNGKLYIISAKDDIPKIVKEDEALDVRAVCWNDNGKHLLIGKGNGSLCRLKQNTYETEHSVSVADVIDGEVQTCDLLWISDEEIATVFTPSGDDDTPKLVLARLAAKDDFESITWRDYDEPSSGFDESRPTQLYLELVRKWNMFVYVSSNSANIAVLSKNRETGVWEIWNLEDSCRAVLPFSKYSGDDSAAIGVGVITGHGGAHPALALLTDDCVLCLFTMVGAAGRFPNIVTGVAAPDLKGEKVASKPLDAKSGPVSLAGASTPPSTSFQKPKLTAKPSIFPTVKPTIPISGITQTPKLTLDKGMPSTRLPILKSLARAPSPVLAKSSVPHSVPKVAPLQPKPAASVPEPTPARKHRAETSGATQSKKSGIPTSSRTTQDSSLLISRAKQASARGKLQPDVKSTVREISDFEEELAKFRDTANETEAVVRQSVDRNKKPKELQELLRFKNEMKTTTLELGREVEDASTEHLTLLSDAKHLSRKSTLKSDGFYRDLMYNRPLAQSQRQKYAELQNLYRYIVDSSQEANALLDYQWQNSAGIGTKQGRPAKTREWESARQALVSNMKAFHDLQVKVLRLEQQIDRLRISSRIALSETASTLSPFSKKQPTTGFAFRAGGDKQFENAEPPSPSRVASERKLSPAKQYKLGKVLALRDNKKAIRADLSKTSILRRMERTNARGSETGTDPDYVEDGTTSPSTVSEEREYSDTEESSEAPDTPVEPIPTPLSMTPHGTATLAYGAPKLASALHRPVGKPFSLAGNGESKMNLNHPPQVVNIKTFDKPAERPKLFASFDPKPEVPAGAVEVVQSVLETVKAEKNQPVPSDWRFMKQVTEKEDGGGGDVQAESSGQAASSASFKKPPTSAPAFSILGRQASTPSPFTLSTPLGAKTTKSGEGLFSMPAQTPIVSNASTAVISAFSTPATAFSVLGAPKPGENDPRVLTSTPATKPAPDETHMSSKPGVFAPAPGGSIFASAPSGSIFASAPVVKDAGESAPAAVFTRPSSEPAGPFSNPVAGSSVFGKPGQSVFSLGAGASNANPDSTKPDQGGLFRSSPSLFSKPPATKPSVFGGLPSFSAPALAGLSLEKTGLFGSSASVTAAAAGSSRPATPGAASTPSPRSSEHAVSTSEPSAPPAADSPAVSSTTNETAPAETTQSEAAPSPAQTPTPLSTTSSAQGPGTPTPSSDTAGQSVVSSSPGPATTAAAPFSVTRPASSVGPVFTLDSTASAAGPESSRTEGGFGPFGSKSTFASSAGGGSAAGGIGGFSSLSFGEKPAATAAGNPFQTAFGQPAAKDETAAQESVFGKSSQPFGATSPFGSKTSQDSTQPGLFGSPAAAQSQSNPFGAPSSQPQPGPFGAPQAQSPFSSFASPNGGSVATQGFGAFGKAAGSAFGGPPKFGSSPAFGSTPAFGGASRTFGTTFGAAPAFGMNSGGEESKGFGSFGSSGTTTGFGALASQGGSSVFGSFGGQGGSTFGSTASQGAGFGTLAGQGNKDQGASPFGNASNQAGSAFGSAANQSGSGGFGAFANQGNSPGFGGLAGQGTGSVFGSQNQGNTGGFGGLGSQSGSAFGSLGGNQSNQFGGGFGAKSDQAAFSGWR